MKVPRSSKLPWGVTWWELLPEGLLAIGLTVFLVTDTSAALSALKSGTAIRLMLLVGVGWLIARVLLVRFTRWPLLRVGVFGAAALTVLSVVVLPAYDDTTVVEALPPELVLLASASIDGIDHDASGDARIYRLSDGELVVGLEEIDIQPGPDYDVYVVPGAGRESVGDGIRLDDLRGNKGTQYYAVPAGTDLATGEWTVLVWCQTFDVPVAGATPTPV